LLLANPELGSKRVGQGCETRFYDLKRSPIICPSCGATFNPEAVLRSRRNRSSAAAAPVVPKAAAVAVEVVDEEVVVDTVNDDDDADEEEVIEDTGDLGEDDFEVPAASKNVDGEET